MTGKTVICGSMGYNTAAVLNSEVFILWKK